MSNILLNMIIVFFLNDQVQQEQYTCYKAECDYIAEARTAQIRKQGGNIEWIKFEELKNGG